MSDVFTVLDLLEIDSKTGNMGLQCIAGNKGLDRIIDSKEVNRPGLALGGFYEFFGNNRIQMFGRGEALFLKIVQNDERFKNVEDFMEYEITCCIFTFNETPPEKFLDLSNKKNIPVLVSNLSTGDINNYLFQILSDFFAKKLTTHGVLVEVFGIGILIKGKSGIGKSETALELIERGHRLVADDTIEIKNLQDRLLEGRGTRVIAHHMEIRGIGIINVKSLYGVRAIRDNKKIQLVIELEEYNPKNPVEFDRLGTEEKYTDILGIKVPYLLIPVMAGRNIPIIIETAAMNQRLKYMGINAAKEFNKELNDYLETEDIKNTFFNLE